MNILHRCRASQRKLRIGVGMNCFNSSVCVCMCVFIALSFFSSSLSHSASFYTHAFIIICCCCCCVIFRVQNFWLHPNESHGNQSFEVHQINRMFNANAISSINKNGAKLNITSNVELIDRKSTRNEQSRRRHHHHHHHHHRIREINEMSTNDDHICATKLRTDNHCLDKNSNRHSITIMDAEPTHRFENGNW